jgi:hypothetical protein
MKAININGNIKIYNQLPKTWGNIIGGFDTLDESEIQEAGFYNLVEPEHTSSIHNLINLHFDSENNIFTYDVENKTFNETVAELKEAKIEQLKDYTNNKLAKTDWYYIRNLNRNIDVPQEVEDSRAAILTDHDTKLNEINSLTTKADIVSYEFE